MVDASIIIRPSSKDDSEGILDLVDVALVEDALFLSRYPKHLNHFATPEETRERRLRMIQAGYDNKRTRAFVAVTDTENGPGKIVGSVVWIAPADPNEPQSATDAEPEWPASADKDWVRKSTEAMQAMRERVCGEQKDDMWYLAALCTHPDIQRRGIGARLVRWGVENADREGRHAYTEATPVGVSLYYKNGFIKKDECNFFDDTYTVAGLLRNPMPRQ